MSSTHSDSPFHSTDEPYIVTDSLTEAGDFRELGVDAVFTLSSAKPGSGVEQLRDGNEETYWYDT